MKLLFFLFFGIFLYTNAAIGAGENTTQESTTSPLMFTDDSLSIDAHLGSLKEFLKKGTCEEPVIEFSVATIKNPVLGIRIRDEVLKLFLESCSENNQFIQQVTSLAVEPNLEWYLKQQAILYSQNQQNVCKDQIVSHLLQFFNSNTTWHIRNAIVWILADIQENCDHNIIANFSQFIQQSPSEPMPKELSDFRQQMVGSILWSLVRLGIRNQNSTVVIELKTIAMRYDVNVYFRIKAVEALQDLSLYLSAAAQALYEIVRDTKRIAQSDFVTYDQRIRDEEDKEVRERAFFALAELVENNKYNFLSFLFIDRELLNYDQVYRRRAFVDQPIPENLDLYARPALIKLANDPKVELKPEHRQLVNALLSGHGNQ